MAIPWPPQKDDELADKAEQMTTVVQADPPAVGCVVADGTLLSGLTTTYKAKLAVTETASTRTPVAIAEKEIAKGGLLAGMRTVGKKIRAFPALTSAQLVALGMNVPSPRTPTPPPATRPVLTRRPTTKPRTLSFRMADETTPTRRARPAGCQGAEIFSFVAPAGTPVPSDVSALKFQGLMTRSLFELTFDGDDVGKTATILVRWYSRTGEVGALSDPISATIAA